jgi:hypothetical protein
MARPSALERVLLLTLLRRSEYVYLVKGWILHYVQVVVAEQN